MKNLMVFGVMVTLTYTTLTGGFSNTQNFESFTGKVHASAMNELTKRSTYNFNKDVSTMMDDFTNAVIAFAE